MTNADFLKRELDELAAATAAGHDDLTDAARARLIPRIQGMLFEHLKAGDVTAVPTGDGTVRLVMAVLGKDKFLAAALRALEDEIRHGEPLLDDGCVRTPLSGKAAPRLSAL